MTFINNKEIQQSRSLENLDIYSRRTKTLNNSVSCDKSNGRRKMILHCITWLTSKLKLHSHGKLHIWGVRGSHTPSYPRSHYPSIDLMVDSFSLQLGSSRPTWRSFQPRILEDCDTMTCITAPRAIVLFIVPLGDLPHMLWSTARLLAPITSIAKRKGSYFELPRWSWNENIGPGRYPEYNHSCLYGELDFLLDHHRTFFRCVFNISFSPSLPNPNLFDLLSLFSLLYQPVCTL